jgi:nucleoside-diphosphate-sugar epimerase
MLQSAAKSKSVKRIVITSSVVVLATKPGASMPGPYDLAPVPDTDKVPANERVAYRASKTLAYKAAQGFMASKQPTFDLVNILPSYV